MFCTPLQARLVFQHAMENHYAILAINADSHAAMVDCLEAAYHVNAPVIIETSLWQLKGRSFGAGNAILGLARYISALMVLADHEKYRGIPVIYHTDHIKGPETMGILQTAIGGIEMKSKGNSIWLSASSISLDASDFSVDENISNVLKLCRYAMEAGVPITLEMESAVDDGITTEEETRRLLGSVEEKFPNHIHLWAPGVGTQHGFGENMNFTPRTIEMHRKLTKEVTGRTIGIALHGSSGLDSVNLSEAARAGVIKVNWSTESLMIRSQAARVYYAQTEKFDRNNEDWKSYVMDNGVNEFVASHYVPEVAERMIILGGGDKAKELMKII